MTVALSVLTHTLSVSGTGGTIPPLTIPDDDVMRGHGHPLSCPLHLLSEDACLIFWRASGLVALPHLSYILVVPPPLTSTAQSLLKIHTMTREAGLLFRIFGALHPSLPSHMGPHAFHASLQPCMALSFRTNKASTHATPSLELRSPLSCDFWHYKQRLKMFNSRCNRAPPGICWST